MSGLGVIEALERRVEDLERQLAELRRAPVAEPEQLLTSSDVAQLLGCSRRAMQERFRRTPDHPLLKLAITTDHVRRWMRADVLRYLASVRGDR